MATLSEKPTKPNKNDTTFVYGHDTKKFRLRAVSAEKDAYSKFISKPLAKKISWTQLILAALICGFQIITIGLIPPGQYYYDSMCNMGGGIWSSVITICAAMLTLWTLKSTKYWKLHLSFAVHIINALAAIIILIVEFGGNISNLRWRVGEALYGDNSDGLGGISHNDRKERFGAHMLIASLVLNSFMATGTLIQLGASFVMTIMTGRAICCGQSKAHGKLFELEIAGSETADGMAVLRSQLQNNLHGLGNIVPVVAAPPPYAESVAESA